MSVFHTASVTPVRTMSAAQTITYWAGPRCFPSPWVVAVTWGSLDQVEQREEEDPDEVDEVPVEAGELDRRRVARAELAAGGPHRHPAQDAHADEHVEPVQAGHEEVDREVHRHARALQAGVVVELARQLPVDPVVVVLDALQHHEGHAE